MKPESDGRKQASASGVAPGLHDIMNRTITFIPALLMLCVAVITFGTNLVAAGIAIAAAGISLIPSGKRGE